MLWTRCLVSLFVTLSYSSHVLMTVYMVQHGMSALHFAANAGHVEVVKALLAASADLNGLDEVGCCLSVCLSVC